MPIKHIAMPFKLHKIFLYILIFGQGISLFSQQKNTASRPNIILVLLDDLGYSDVGFNGSKDITTPTLDKLANNGTIFTSAYVPHPFCGPSRASLMTGVYSHTIGAQFNLPRNNTPAGKGIPVEETFISKVLQNAGYHTGIVGKWHLGVDDGFTPNERGFDDFYGFLGGGHKYFPDQYKKEYQRQKANGISPIWDYILPLEHNGIKVDETEYLTDALSREAVRFIDDNSNLDQEKPFFLYVAYNAPHTPLEAKASDILKFNHIKNKDRRTYAAMVYAVDRGVKKIVEKLKETGAFDDTLIIFFSDNGGRLDKGATNVPLAEGKGSTHEGGYRTPMFFHWPNAVPSGKKFHHSITALDIYPTLAHLAGAQIPTSKKLDGKNIWNDFKTGNPLHPDENIYVLRHRTKWSDVGIRKNQWKALKVYNQSWKLFDLNKDPGEKKNLSNRHPDILKQMIKEAEFWSRSHKEPNWFHNMQTQKMWKKESMPRFDVTFELN